MKKAVVLLSGGLDSCVTLAKANEEGYEPFTISFDYGQRHDKELISAKDIAEFYKVKEHRIMKIDLSQIGGSALTDEEVAVPEGRGMESIGKNIPITYVPARNTIFLSLAMAYAEVIDAEAIFIGANALDFSGYPDCRTEYFQAFQRVVNVGSKAGVEGRSIFVKAPIISMTKAEIIKEGMRLNAPLHLTWSCYKGGEMACGKCDSCLLRLKGFGEAGLEDPIAYEE